MPDDTPISIVYEEYTEVTLSDTEYTLIATPGHTYIVKNKSGYPIYLAQNLDRSALTGDTTQILLGGLTYEYMTDENMYVWVRATTANSVVSIRPIGTVDPSADVASLSVALNDLAIQVTQHHEDMGNPHMTTKEQVGLSNIPNAIDSNENTDRTDTLATTALTHKLKVTADTHIAQRDNPHAVTKAQVGLGNVDNYPTADYTNLADCLETVSNKFVTPAASYRIARLATAVAYSIKPQLVVASTVGSLPNGWLEEECDTPSKAIWAYDDAHVVTRAGLVLSYGTDHKSRLTEPLAADIITPISLDSDITHYVYADISIEGHITGVGTTVLPPIYDTHRRGRVGDWFDIDTCMMYDQDDTEIRRVYLGRVVVTSRAMTVIPVPVGDRYVVPLGTDLVLSGRYLLDNPFNARQVTVTPEVAYRDAFGPTCWNDQIGVLGHVHPLYPTTIVVVQAGQMGFLAGGRESGTPFGSAFTTVTTTLRTRVVMQRDF